MKHSVYFAPPTNILAYSHSTNRSSTRIGKTCIVLAGLVFKRKARRGISWVLIVIADWRMGLKHVALATSRTQWARSPAVCNTTNLPTVAVHAAAATGSV